MPKRISQCIAALADRVGRRGATLLLIGMIALGIAFSLLDIPPELRHNPAYAVAASLLPLTVWAGWWLAAALVCLVQAFMREDRIAFGIASGVILFWGAASLYGWAIGLNSRGWVGGTLWIGLGSWLAGVVSGWAENPRLRRPR